MIHPWQARLAFLLSCRPFFLRLEAVLYRYRYLDFITGIVGGGTVQVLDKIE